MVYKQQKGQDVLEGILVVNKPAGMTSHDVVDRVRRRLGMRRVGHAGTLDPLATGVLIILVGRSTKLFNRFMDFDKAYRATLRLGLTTTTADIQGEVLQEKDFSGVNEDALRDAFSGFVGDIEQIPPMVSAVKVKGRRLYELARKGIEVERKPRRIHIERIDLKSFSAPDAEFFLECSKGTYVRKLAEDVGEVVGCGACVTQIERTRVGPYTLDQAVELDQIREEDLRPFSE